MLRKILNKLFRNKVPKFPYNMVVEYDMVALESTERSAGVTTAGISCLIQFANEHPNSKILILCPINSITHSTFKFILGFIKSTPKYSNIGSIILSNDSRIQLASISADLDIKTKGLSYDYIHVENVDMFGRTELNRALYNLKLNFKPDFKIVLSGTNYYSDDRFGEFKQVHIPKANYRE